MYLWGFRYIFFFIKLNNIFVCKFIAGYIQYWCILSLQKGKKTETVNLKNTEVTKFTERGTCIELDCKYTSTKVPPSIVFQNGYFLFFKDERS